MWLPHRGSNLRPTCTTAGHLHLLPPPPTILHTLLPDVLCQLPPLFSSLRPATHCCALAFTNPILTFLHRTYHLTSCSLSVLPTMLSSQEDRDFVVPGPYTMPRQLTVARPGRPSRRKAGVQTQGSHWPTEVLKSCWAPPWSGGSLHRL